MRTPATANERKAVSYGHLTPQPHLRFPSWADDAFINPPRMSRQSSCAVQRQLDGSGDGATGCSGDLWASGIRSRHYLDLSAPHRLRVAWLAPAHSHRHSHSQLQLLRNAIAVAGVGLPHRRHCIVDALVLGGDVRGAGVAWFLLWKRGAYRQRGTSEPNSPKRGVVLPDKSACRQLVITSPPTPGDASDPPKLGRQGLTHWFGTSERAACFCSSVLSFEFVVTELALERVRFVVNIEVNS